MIKENLDIESLRITWRDKGYCSCHHIPLKKDKCAVQWLKKKAASKPKGWTEYNQSVKEWRSSHLHKLIQEWIDEAFEDMKK